MPPIKAVKNQYIGINAHLHSYWQAEGGWHEFHNNHISDLARQMNLQLVPMGYSAATETSIQVRRDDMRVGEPESDVTIYDVRGGREQRKPFEPSGVVAELAIAEIPALMEERAEYRALSIQKLGLEGQPVGWVEVLSPSNKPGASNFTQYFEKRLAMLRLGLVFVELDYLNNSKPTLDEFRDGLPYRIAIFDPHPDYYSGRIFKQAFGVDDPIPTLDIPLVGNDILHFDFGASYQRTIEELFLGQRFVDYAETPLGMNHYRSEDQLRIFKRMQAIAKAVRDGVDLETNAPLPVDAL